ncbi:MAG: 1,4-alpha-glucan branching protein domain-containing protein [Armatimonadia bacterium]
MKSPFGAFVMILHGHIPYVLGHGTWPHGSNMIYEAAAETYIPLLWALEELVHEGISPNITISLSPITVEQLADERFKMWFEAYLTDKQKTAQRDAAEFQARGDGHLAFLAGQWEGRYRSVCEAFIDGYDRDLVAAFRRLQDGGHIEVMTCAATHGYLPLLHEDASIQAQILQSVQTYEQHFGRRPRGIWLPECAYRPRCRWAPPPEIGYPETPYPRKGIEEFLGENGFDYFVVDTHMLGGGNPLPVSVSREDTLGKAWGHIRHVREASPYYGAKTPYRPYFVGDRFEDHPPVAILVRDPDTSQQVWSGWRGYPGDYCYLEFHKKHMPGDLRYWRVTDDLNDLSSKAPYEPQLANDRLQEHAGHFLSLVKEKLRNAPWEGGMPLVCAPFDAELFGHWWFEGPRWMSKMLRWMNQDPEISVMTASAYLAAHSPDRATALPEGSWGAGGGHYVWMNNETAWTWHRVYDAEKDFRALVREHGRGHDEVMQRLVRQAARELLLLQASDWQFLITTWSARDYAEARLNSHYNDFKSLMRVARDYAAGRVVSDASWAAVGRISDRDRPFAKIDPTWWGRVKRPAIG